MATKKTSDKTEAKAAPEVVTKESPVLVTAAPKPERSPFTILSALGLMTIGGLILLSSFDLIQFDFWALLRLWPLLLVVAGLSILAGYSSAMRTLASIGLFAVGVVAVLFALGAPAVTDWRTDRAPMAAQVSDSVFVDQDVKSVEVDINMAGRLDIGTQDSDAMMVFEGPGLRFDNEREGNIEKFKLTNSASDSGFRFGGGLRDGSTKVKFGQHLPLALDIKFGVGEVMADLRGLKLSRLNIDSGASDIEVKLDSIDQKRVLVDLDLGVSGIRLHLPESAGVIVRSDSGLSNIDLPELQSKGNGVFESANLTQAETVYEIKIDSGLTDFKLRYLKPDLR